MRIRLVAVGQLVGLALAVLMAAPSSAAAMPAAKRMSALAPAYSPASAVAAAAAGTRVYAGSTTPALTPMIMGVKKSRVRQIAVMYSTDCFSYASRLSASALRRARIGKNGRFKVSVVTSLLDSPRVWWSSDSYPDQIIEKFKGRVRGGQARGTVRATLTFLDGSTCTTGEQRWLVSHKRSRVFGGITSQSMPVSVELSASGRRINHLHVGWTAACPDGSAWIIPDFLTNFTLTAGAVDETFRQEYPGAEGGIVRFDYHLVAAVRKSTSTGTLKVTVTELTAAGEATSVCTSPTVTWTARS